MLPYFSLLLLTLPIFALSQYYRCQYYSISEIFRLFVLITLVFFSSLRSEFVGTDSYTYVAFWNLALADGLDSISFFSEPIFAYYNYFSKLLAQIFNFDYWFFFFGISMFVCYIYLNSIDNYAEYKIQSFAIFILMGFYTFHYNGARQAITIAIFLYSYRYIVRGSFTKYMLCMTMAFFVHKTAILLIPFYFLFRIGFTIISVAIITITSSVLFLFINVMVGFASNYDARYSSYASTVEAGGGLVTVSFYSLLLFWLWFCRQSNSISNQLYDHSLLAILVSVCIGWGSVILSLDPSGILRMMVYLTQFSIFSIPLSLMSFSRGPVRDMFIIVFYICMIFYFYLTTSNFSNYTPYQSSFDSIL